MGNRYSKEYLMEALAALEAAGGNMTQASINLGLSRTTFQSQIYAARRLQMAVAAKKPILADPLPADDVPIESVVDHMCKRYEKRAAHTEATKWRAFRVKELAPIGICWFGDPHIDDNGCNWPLLREHIKICKETPGLYGANIGDTHNNWVGRLVKEYANQDTSVATAYKLIEWFFLHSGVRWLIMLTGNHDSWNDEARLLKKICANVCPMVDWRAQFKLVFPNERECLIDAAHDHKGGSMWNPLHAQQKASTIGGRAHFYIAGHRHTWGLAKHECPETNRSYWLARARGYKHLDEYAVTCGFGAQMEGSAILQVIDPTARESQMVTCFDDIAAGAEYLKYLRNRK